MKRLSPSNRKAQILAAVLPVARRMGYQAIGWVEAGMAANVSESLVRKYFGTIPQLHRAIVSAAIVQRDARIIAQGVAAGDSKAKRAPEDLLIEAAALIRGAR